MEQNEDKKKYERKTITARVRDAITWITAAIYAWKGAGVIEEFSKRRNITGGLTEVENTISGFSVYSFNRLMMYLIALIATADVMAQSAQGFFALCAPSVLGNSNFTSAGLSECLRRPQGDSYTVERPFVICLARS